jgi:biopolymer transport protein ExbD
MKRERNVLLVATLLFLTSCASITKFPVSNTLPAAEITAKTKQDKNKNYTIEVTAKHLASPDRLNPPKSNYNVWIVTEENGTMNLGMLTNKNAKTAVLKTKTPFKVIEIFITAEDQGNNSSPNGIEISRTNLNR